MIRAGAICAAWSLAMAPCGCSEEDADPVARGTAGPCEACDRTADCAAPLRCRDFLCGGAAACDGERPDAADGGAPERAAEAPQADPGGCDGLCAVAARTPCDAFRTATELGASRQECVAVCAAGVPAADDAVLSCLRERADRGECDDASLRECLPPWAPTLAGPACTGVDCRCGRFCDRALACGLFEGAAMAVDRDGCLDLCRSGDRESPGSLGCLEDAFDEERCEAGPVMACFGAEDGGRPPGSEGR